MIFEVMQVLHCKMMMKIIPSMDSLHRRLSCLECIGYSMEHLMPTHGIAQSRFAICNGKYDVTCVSVLSNILLLQCRSYRYVFPFLDFPTKRRPPYMHVSHIPTVKAGLHAGRGRYSMITHKGEALAEE